MSTASSLDQASAPMEDDLRQDPKRSRLDTDNRDQDMEDTSENTSPPARQDGILQYSSQGVSSHPGEALAPSSAGQRIAAAAAGESIEDMSPEDNATHLARAKAFHQLYTSGKLKYEYAGQELPPFVGVVPHLQGCLIEGYADHYETYSHLNKLDNGQRVLTAEQYTQYLKAQFAKELAEPGEEIQGVSSRTARLILAGKGAAALEKRLEALAISRRRPGPSDPYETEEQQQAFMKAIEAEELAVIKEAEALGWKTYQSKNRELDVLAKAEFWMARIKTFEPNPESLSLRTHLLSFFEETGKGLISQRVSAEGEIIEMDDFEKQARIHACGTMIQQIQVIDEYNKLGMRKWLLEQKRAEWTPDGLFIESWVPVDIPTDEWGHEESDYREEQEELDCLIQLAQRTEQRDASLEEQLISHLRIAQSLQAKLDELVPSPLLDPHTPPPPTEKPTASMLRDMLIKDLSEEFDPQHTLTPAHAQHVASIKIPARFENIKLPPRGRWIQVKIHHVHVLHTIGDPARYRSAAVNRQQFIQVCRARGIYIRHVACYTPDKRQDMSTTMDWEADVLVNEALQEWLEGRRTVWFGDPEQNTQTRVFATYTPPGAYWLDLEGAQLVEFVEGVHNVNPHSHDYLACMLLLHGFIRSAGYKNVGPVR
eukprot:3936100-Rhodomonas_salina.1